MILLVLECFREEMGGGFFVVGLCFFKNSFFFNSCVSFFFALSQSLADWAGINKL